MDHYATNYPQSGGCKISTQGSQDAPSVEPATESQGTEARCAVATGSVSPLTDDAWDAYNRRACGLHYIAHKMRGMEIALRRIIALGANMPDDAEEVRIAKEALDSPNAKVRDESHEEK